MRVPLWSWQGEQLAEEHSGDVWALAIPKPLNAEEQSGDEQAKEGFLWHMAGRLEIPEASPEPDEAKDRETPQSGGTPPGRGTNTVIERWLQLHLRQLYEEVSNEPLPSDLSDLIDRFRKRRQEAEAGTEPVAPSPPVRQGS